MQGELQSTDPLSPTFLPTPMTAKSSIIADIADNQKELLSTISNKILIVKKQQLGAVKRILCEV